MGEIGSVVASLMASTIEIKACLLGTGSSNLLAELTDQKAPFDELDINQRAR